MRFSEYYELTPNGTDDWFDPLLTTDTRLYVDPFRVYVDAEPHWAGAHDHLLTFFDIVLKLVREANGNTTSPPWHKAQSLLLFPEPWEFCLGMAEGSPKGSGSGKGLQRDMLSGARTAVGLGIDTIEHMELLVLFQERIGVDRISDIVCNVMKSYFVRYTQEVCRRHGVPMVDQPVRHSDWDEHFGRWEARRYELPINPWVKGPLLLAPKRFLRDMPTADPDDFWRYAWNNENEQLRADFNYDLATNVPAKTKARMARQNPELAMEYLRSLEAEPKEPYDIEVDPDHRVRWWEDGGKIASRHPLSFVPEQPAEFPAFIEAIINSFAHGLEESDSWRLLWNGGRPRGEKHVQTLFRSTVLHYCRANHVDLGGETNAGRGPMDFKFVANWQARAGVEIKLTSNSGYWDGLKNQLPQYLRSEELKLGYFVSVGFREADFTPERMDKVRAAVEVASKDSSKDLRVIFVDAQPKKSASKLTDKDRNTDA